MATAEGTGDPFGTAGLRRRVVEAWAASPARFREDANAEEELALGAYRGRVVVELAQNAADAAVQAGSAGGRLLLRLGDGVLVAANTGAPLDAVGVEALSTLRASSKRDAGPATGASTTGRFGVGFAALRSVSDDITVESGPAAVRWSTDAARAALTGVPSLAPELERRDGGVPALRLPFPAPATGVPQGYDTAVRLRLRDDVAVESVQAELAAVGVVLLLALPALAEVTVETPGSRRTLRRGEAGDGEVTLLGADGGPQRWRTATDGGVLEPPLLADRPVEERRRPTWSVTWAVRLDDHGRPQPSSAPAVVHAPTPTDEPLHLPAVLLGSFPLDSTRRWVAPGPLRDFVAERAGELYADIVGVVGAAADGGAAALELIPGPVAGGEVDAAIRHAALEALGRRAFVPSVDGRLLRPRDCLLLPEAGDALLELLADPVPGLVSAAWAVPGTRTGVLTRLGASVRTIPEVLEELAGVRWEPQRWRRLYAALASAGLPPDQLGALPVPLTDGRLVRGPRGCLVPGADADAVAPLAELLGLRLVHPDAVHPLLERLGASPATAAAVLAEPMVAAAVADSADGGMTGLPEAVLRVIGAALEAGATPQLPPGLTLPSGDGEQVPASELVLPGSPFAELVDSRILRPVAAAVAARWGPAVLTAAGVLDRFTLVHDSDVLIDPELADAEGHGLDGEADWCDAVLDALLDDGRDIPVVMPEFLAVRDLDAVHPDAWPQALTALAGPGLRDAVVAPAHVAVAAGRRSVPSYAAWWLRTYAEIDGVPLTSLRMPGSDPTLAGLYDEAPALPVDAEFLAAVGVRTSLPALLADPDGAEELLERLADPALPVSAAQLRRLYAAMARAGGRVRPPESVRIPAGGGTRVVPADEVIVVDAPDLLPLAAGRPAICLPGEAGAGLADLLDLPMLADVQPTGVETTGTTQPVPAEVSALLPGVPSTWLEHDDLLVGGVFVDWRCFGGEVHACTPEGLARGLAWAAGRWDRRFLVAAVLAEPERAAEFLDDEVWTG